MKFGKTLFEAIYAPWKASYIDYSKLKHLLQRKKVGDAREAAWTDDDESRFAEELFNVQLEKVYSLQTDRYERIRTQMSRFESRLESLQLQKLSEEDTATSTQSISKKDEETLREVLAGLNGISTEISQLERFSRINFTGFRKIVKKHDKRRGVSYKLRAILAARLAALPLGSEDYSPFLFRLSAMYSFIQSHLKDKSGTAPPMLSSEEDDDEYSSSTFFVHPDDLIEVKTTILRHLPLLVYESALSKGMKTTQDDPSLTSIYFDSPRFNLYEQRLERQPGASSLRMRWFGLLQDIPEVMIERKTLAGQLGSKDERISLKKKHIVPFLNGTYSLQRQISKLREKGGEAIGQAERLEAKVQVLQSFIEKDDLRPCLRATYNRSAFQVPGDDAVRISIDKSLKFAKVNLQASKGIFVGVNATSVGPQSHDTPEETDFPWAVLTIKTRAGSKETENAWVRDLTSSHLLREAPRFSKFIHGIASLFEDSVTELPFWISLMDTDIRRDPQSAFEAERNREEQLIEEMQAVGSYGGIPRRKNSVVPQATMTHSQGSPRYGALAASRSLTFENDIKDFKDPSKPTSDDLDTRRAADPMLWFSGLRNILPSISTSKYAKAIRAQSDLPPGVEEPYEWIKNAGPIKVEPKVWLANQRTFIKWQHVSVLLAGLSLGLYNGAGRKDFLAQALGVVYTIIAVLIGLWGWYMHTKRSRVIRNRDGADLDNVLGPVVVSVSLGVALALNLRLGLTT